MSGKPTIEEALKQEGGVVHISYLDFMVTAPKKHVESTIEELGAMSAEDREYALKSVKKSLEDKHSLMSKIKEEETPVAGHEQTIMEYMQDIAIWFANEIFEGRAKLEETMQ